MTGWIAPALAAVIIGLLVFALIDSSPWGPLRRYGPKNSFY